MIQPVTICRKTLETTADTFGVEIAIDPCNRLDKRGLYDGV